MKKSKVMQSLGGGGGGGAGKKVYYAYGRCANGESPVRVPEIFAKVNSSQIPCRL